MVGIERGLSRLVKNAEVRDSGVPHGQSPAGAVVPSKMFQIPVGTLVILCHVVKGTNVFCCVEKPPNGHTFPFWIVLRSHCYGKRVKNVPR